MDSLGSAMPAGGPYELILTRGTFYFPAWKHYGNPETVVKCDRCERTELLTCVGYDRMDLCMNCVEIVARWLQRTGGVESVPRRMGPGHEPESHPVVTLMLQPMFRPPQTRMMQSMFGSNGR